jgi:hypothetical protein
MRRRDARRTDRKNHPVRCHIGHVMTAEVLAAAKLEMLENDRAVCVRASNERADLCREIARKREALSDSAVRRVGERLPSRQMRGRYSSPSSPTSPGTIPNPAPSLPAMPRKPATPTAAEIIITSPLRGGRKARPRAQSRSGQ